VVRTVGLDRWSGSNQARKPPYYVRAGYQPRQHRAGHIPWRFPTRTRVLVPVLTPTKSGEPSTIATTAVRFTGYAVPSKTRRNHPFSPLRSPPVLRLSLQVEMVQFVLGVDLSKLCLGKTLVEFSGCGGPWVGRIGRPMGQ